MNRLIILATALAFASCQSKPTSNKVESTPVSQSMAMDCTGTKSASCAGCPAMKGGTIETVSVDSIQKNPEKYFDKTIALKGRVIHTCKESGKKMFLAGSNEEKLVRVEAGEKINRFDASLQGEIVVAKGILTPIADQMAEAPKDGKATCATEGKAKQYILTCSEFEIVAKNN